MRWRRVSAVALVVLVGAFAPAANAVTLQMLTSARWVGPAGPVPVTEGTVIDPTHNPYLLYDVAVRVSEEGNRGLGGVFFDTRCQEMADQGLFMNMYDDAEAGHGNHSSYFPLQDVKSWAYPPEQPSAGPANYAGGWGFDNSGFPTGGEANAPGFVEVAGNSAPLIWAGDYAPWLPGLQSLALLGVGQGSNVGRPEDPIFAGTTLGRQAGPMPQDLANSRVPGDGEWVMFRALLDMTGMAVAGPEGPILYTVDIIPLAGTFLMLEEDFEGPAAGLTYYDELGGGFRSGDWDSMTGDSFSFYVPEPASLGLLLAGGFALVRRRR